MSEMQNYMATFCGLDSQVWHDGKPKDAMAWSLPADMGVGNIS
jgi:hypothetical protein